MVSVAANAEPVAARNAAERSDGNRVSLGVFIGLGLVVDIGLRSFFQEAELRCLSDACGFLRFQIPSGCSLTGNPGLWMIGRHPT